MMPVKWTNRSRPPSSGVMKPKPLSSENHLTVPVPTDRPHFWTWPTAAALALQNVSGSRGGAQEQLAGQFLRGCSDLVAIAGRRHPWQAQRVGVVARDHVHVEVEDRLPGGL